MIKPNRTPGIHLIHRELCDAPRRPLAKDHLTNLQSKGASNYSLHHGIPSKHANRSLRSLTNQSYSRVDKKSLPRNDSQKVIRSSFNPEEGQRVSESRMNHETKNAFSRNQSQVCSSRGSPDTLADYLKKKAPRVSAEIRKGLPINEKMRKHVMIWLIELFHGARLKQETLFHCAFLFDHMLSQESALALNIENLQLLALTCFFISCKYEEIYPPAIKKCVQIADFTYSKAKIVEMEASVLAHNQFCLTFPTRFTFSEHILAEYRDLPHNKLKRLQDLTLYLLEISLMSMWEDASEDEVGQAACFLAAKVLQMEIELPCRKVCQLAWSLMKVWKENKSGVVAIIFDSDRYSFVGGIHLEGV